jgi:hypothetical protein
VEFSPSVAADGHQCGARPLGVVGPEVDQGAVYQRGTRMHEVYNGFALLETDAQILARGG